MNFLRRNPRWNMSCTSVSLVILFGLLCAGIRALRCSRLQSVRDDEQRNGQNRNLAHPVLLEVTGTDRIQVMLWTRGS